MESGFYTFGIASKEICRKPGAQWATRPIPFDHVVDWLNWHPGQPEPPLRYLLNYTVMRIGYDRWHEAPDVLQLFWFGTRNEFEGQVRRSYDYKPHKYKRPMTLEDYFWWFITINLRQFCNRREAERRKKELPISYTDDPETEIRIDEFPDPTQSYQLGRRTPYDELPDAVFLALEQLPEIEKIIFRECTLGQRERSEIAKELGITVGTLNVKYLRIKRFIRKIVGIEQ